MSKARIRRRDFLRYAIGSAVPAAVAACGKQSAAPAARVVIIGGGFAGSTCARYLKILLPDVEVTLIEVQKRYLACPMSNWVIGGLRSAESLAVSRTAVQAAGVKLVYESVREIDAFKKRVTLASGSYHEFDFCVAAPGIQFKWGIPEGYDEAASQIMPHAWHAGAQTTLLQKQLQDMEDGGVVAISVPAAPYRCPPGPYERASLMAHYCKLHKPRAKILILDGNEKFSKQALFQAAWKELYGDMISWIPLTEDGGVKRVEVSSRTLYTDFAEHRVHVANVIPAQSAAQILLDTGLVDSSGWCPVDANTFESRHMPNVFVIGDAAIMNPMPKSASAANSQAKNCALTLTALIKGAQPAAPVLHNTCYSLVAPEYGISVNGMYRVQDGEIAATDGAGGVSPAAADADFRMREADYNLGWYDSIIADAFG